MAFDESENAMAQFLMSLPFAAADLAALPAAISALAALVSATAALIWSIRRRP